MNSKTVKPKEKLKKCSIKKLLPRIYGFSSVIGGIKDHLSSKILSSVDDEKTDEKPSILILHAPTGTGKTVACARLIAAEVARLRAMGIKCSGHLLMPFRISVKEMTSYLEFLKTELGENLVYGSAVSGDVRRSKEDHVVLQTVGYFLQSFGNGSSDPSVLRIVMLDEAHDATWQTDLTLAYLMREIRQGANLKLIISSATLDVAKIESQYKVGVNLISVEEGSDMRHIIEFNSKATYRPIDGQKLSPDFFKTMAETLEKAYKITKSGHLLVLLPGLEEIETLMQMMIDRGNLDENAIHHILHGQQSKEDSDAALGNPKNKSDRHIIYATAVAENAITINGLVAVVDSCLRKVFYADADGVGELRLEMASQTNIVQAYGRCGRQGSPGWVFITVSKELYDTLPKFSPNEVERNPTYPQLMMVIRNGDDPRDVLSHVQPTKLSDDLAYLEKYGLIVKTAEGKYELTEAGAIVADLPCGIRTGKFIFNAIKHAEKVFDFAKYGKREGVYVRSKYYYYVCLVVAWIESKNSVFERLTRRHPETNVSFLSRKGILEYNQDEFSGSDCMETFFNVFFNSPIDTRKLRVWCRENGIFFKTIVEIDRNADNLMRAMAKVVGHPIEKQQRLYDFATEYEVNLRELLTEPLIQTFEDSRFSYGKPPRNAGQKADYLPVTKSRTRGTFIFDRSVKNLIKEKQLPTFQVLALGLRRTGTMHFMTSIVCVDHRPSPVADQSPPVADQSPPAVVQPPTIDDQPSN